MDTDKRMIVWCSAWIVTDGFVVCTSCKNFQPVTKADDPFQQSTECDAASKVEAHPWVTLHDILDRERG